MKSIYHKDHGAHRAVKYGKCGQTLAYPHSLLSAVSALSVVMALSLLVAASLAGADEAARLYNQGNALYRAGKFPEAVETYEHALATGVRNGRIYYNLGNACFKIGRLGKGILAYERAQRLMPGDDDVASNLQFANLLKIDKETDGEVNTLTRFGRWLVGLFGANTLSVVCSLCLFGVAGGLGVRLFRPEERLRPILLGLAFTCGGLLLFAGGLLTLKIHSAEFGDEAIVMVGESTGRSGPGDDNVKVFILHEGTKVAIQRSEGGWILARLPSGIGGWVRAKDLDKI